MKYERYVVPLIGGIIVGAILAKAGAHAYRSRATTVKCSTTSLYPAIGRTWTSSKWANGKKRTLKELATDPYDSNLEYSDGAPPAPLTIKGDGTAYNNNPSSSYRIYVKGPWLNTEQTIYVRFRKQGRDVQLHSRSSHNLGGKFNIPWCKFAGYHVIWDRIRNVAEVECEVLSQIIARNLVSAPIPPIPLNVWTGFKQITRTSSAGVKVEGYILTDTSTQNWAKSVEYTFDGTNTDFTPLHNVNDKYYQEWQNCIPTGPPATDLIKYSRWLNAEKMCWVRTNDVEGVDFKCWEIHEIAPLN